MLTTTKVCTACQLPKTLAEFYVRSGCKNPTEPGHYLSECIACMKLRNFTRKLIPIEESRVPTENLAIKRLKQENIWAQTGKASNAPDVDVTAMGMVRIEVKHSRLEYRRGKEMFRFDTTPKQQQRGFLADLVMLICEWKLETLTYHLFRANDPVFYIHGHVKTGLTYPPGRTHALKHGNNRVVMTQSMMDTAENHWQLVPELYYELSQHLSETVSVY